MISESEAKKIAEHHFAAEGYKDEENFKISRPKYYGGVGWLFEFENKALAEGDIMSMTFGDNPFFVIESSGEVFDLGPDPVERYVECYREYGHFIILLGPDIEPD